jgi:acetyl-CoA carboxylase carboxyl transferase subunit alpha
MPGRPTALDYLKLAFEDFVELHGDRLFRDDPALVGGLARLAGRPVVVLGEQKGRDTKENILRSFGMPNPEGYRKAVRLMRLAEKFGLPVVSLVDTIGAYPGVSAEEHGQAWAIAESIRTMLSLQVPVLAVILGEGGSGGALAIAAADRVLILQNAWYSVISPESCAAILWRDAAEAPKAAEALQLSAADLLAQGLVEEVIPEPSGGAHTDPQMTAATLKLALQRHLDELCLLGGEQLVAGREARFRRLGVFGETPLP